MEPVTFLEANPHTGKLVYKGKKKEIKKYIALTVAEAMDALRTRKNDFNFYRIKDIDTYNVYFAISDKKTPEIFVMKHFKRKNDSFQIESDVFKRVSEMNDLCQSVLVAGKGIAKGDVRWILMEYFDGSLLDIERKLTEKERRAILRTITQAVKCLREKGYYYTDMKLDQVLYRINEDDSITVKLADLEVSRKGESTLVTYSPPRSKFTTSDGFFRYGATDEAVNWGLTILILELWTIHDRKLHRAFKNYHRHRKHMLQTLEGKVPDDIFSLLSNLYRKWDDIPTEDIFKVLSV